MAIKKGIYYQQDTFIEVFIVKYHSKLFILVNIFWNGLSKEVITNIHTLEKG